MSNFWNRLVDKYPAAFCYIAALCICIIFSPKRSYAGQAPDFSVDGSDIPGGNTFFSELTEFLNGWGQFMTSTLGLTIVFVGMVACLITWILAPRAGEAVAMGLRTVVAGFVLLNAGGLISWFAGTGTP